MNERPNLERAAEEAVSYSRKQRLSNSQQIANLRFYGVQGKLAYVKQKLKQD